LRGLLPGLLYTFLTAAASAQPAHLVFKQFTQSEGLPDYTIQAVTRDQAGFLWIGTQKGLNRYDGARFSNMSEQADWHLGDSHILTLVADPSDPMAVWGNTLTGELFKADGHGNIPPFAFTFEAQTLLAEEGGGLW